MTPTTDNLPLDLREALEACASGDSSTALSLLVQAASRHPRSGSHHLLLAAEHAGQGHLAEAEHSFSNALLVQPDLHIARYQLGLLQFSSGRVAQAQLTWQPLMNLGPQHVLPHLVQGFVHLAVDAFEDSRRCFEEGLRLNTDNPALTSDIQKVLERMRAVSPNAAPQSAPAEEGNANHFLLNSYQQGSVH